MDRKTIYVVNNPHVFDGTPNGTIEKPYATIEEALFELSDDKDSKVFICMNIR